MEGDSVAAFRLSQMNDQQAMQIAETTMQCAMGCHSEVLTHISGEIARMQSRAFLNVERFASQCNTKLIATLDAMSGTAMSGSDMLRNGRKECALTRPKVGLACKGKKCETRTSTTRTDSISTLLDRVLCMASPHFNVINATKSFNSQKIFRITIQIGNNINSP